MIYLTLPRAAAWLQTVDPRLTARFLDCPYEQADFTNKYLLSAWSVLSNRLEFVLTENLVRTLILQSPFPESAGPPGSAVTRTALPGWSI